AIANDSTTTTPWSPTSHRSDTFVETGIDLTTLLGANGGCFTNFLAETRSSDVLTATLKDFASGSCNTCVTPTLSTTATPGESTPYADGSKFYVAGSHTDATDECFTVVKNSPALSTTQNPAAGAIGATYNGTAHLTGGASPTGTITFTLYSNNNCTGVLDTE